MSVLNSEFCDLNDCYLIGSTASDAGRSSKSSVVTEYPVLSMDGGSQYTDNGTQPVGAILRKLK